MIDCISYNLETTFEAKLGLFFLLLQALSRNIKLVVRLHFPTSVHCSTWSWAAAPQSAFQLEQVKHRRCTCSACEMLFWEIPSGRRLVCAQKDQSWHTWSSKVGFDVMGIWRAGDDRSDINSVSVDPTKELVAVADDDGTVRFHCPRHAQ